VSRSAVAAALLALLVLVGCGGAATRPPAANLPARGYHPELFPDIPLAPSFVLDPGRDQLAVSAGGGLVRRFDVGLLQKGDAKVQSPSEILDWYGRILPGLGWTAAGVASRERLFRRERSAEVAEILHVAAGNHGGVTGLDLRLEPAAPAPTTP
jgi:hypothetical protein